MFEMAAGYELSHLRPGETEYRTVDEKVRPVLEYIFDDGFPHTVDQVSVSKKNSNDIFSSIPWTILLSVKPRPWSSLVLLLWCLFQCRFHLMNFLKLPDQILLLS